MLNRSGAVSTIQKILEFAKKYFSLIPVNYRNKQFLLDILNIQFKMGETNDTLKWLGEIERNNERNERDLDAVFRSTDIEMFNFGKLLK